MPEHFDLIVIGTGPAGQKAAVQAAKLGRRVLAVERGGRLGGVSVHSGTIPSKALREAVLVLAGLRSRRIKGVEIRFGESLGVAELVSHTAGIVTTETAIVRDQLLRNGVELVYGTASFDGPSHVRIVAGDESTVYSADRFVVAVGTRPVRPPEIPFDGNRVLDTESILTLPRIPQQMIVIGAGVIGCEYACMMARLGARVDLVDRRRQLLKFVDREIAEYLAYHMWSSGIHLRLGEDVERVHVNGGDVSVSLSSGEVLEGDTILYVQRRVACTNELNLQKAGLEAVGGGLLAVNSRFQTDVPHIYAAGDVIGFPSLAATSMEQGRLAALNAFGIPAETFPDLLPYGLYTIPELSMVGRSEVDLKADAVPYVAGRAFYREIARGQLVGDCEGLLKLLFHRETRKILGIHAIGEGATELVHIGQTAMSLGGTAEFFVSNVFNYPTFAECYRVAGLDGLNRLAGTESRARKGVPPVLVGSTGHADG